MNNRRIRTTIVTAVAALTASTAYAAGNHQICYQGPKYNSLPTIVVQCRSDVPGATCSISMNASSAPIYPTPAGASTVRAYQGAIGTSHTATINFSDGTQRFCTTSLPGYGYEPGPAYAKASGATVPVLTGYTTDESGLLMTGIWSSRTQSALRVQRNTVGVSRDFVLVGGGALGTDYPSGALISKMVPAGDLQKREFWVETQDAIVADPHDNETYAIGMKIEGVSVFDLRNLVVWTSGNSGSQAVPHPSGQVSPPSGFGAILGGGAGTFTYYPVHGAVPHRVVGDSRHLWLLLAGLVQRVERRNRMVGRVEGSWRVGCRLRDALDQLDADVDSGLDARRYAHLYRGNLRSRRAVRSRGTSEHRCLGTKRRVRVDRRWRGRRLANPRLLRKLALEGPAARGCSRRGSLVQRPRLYLARDHHGVRPGRQAGSRGGPAGERSPAA